MLQWGMTTRVLILGASYGSLLATKLLMAGHRVTLVCTGPTAELINREGTVVRFPQRGRAAPLDVASKELPGVLSAATPEGVDPAAFDLVVLGMQEAQYAAPGVRLLMRRIAEARKPCLAIMNMPPLPYLRRLAGLWMRPLEGCYADPEVWDGFDPALMTLASPDKPPQTPASRGPSASRCPTATGRSTWMTGLPSCAMRRVTVPPCRARISRAMASVRAELVSSFSRARLAHANLQEANLQDASFPGADLTGTRLDAADLRHANLRGVNLAGALGLTQAQVDSACLDEQTALPAGLNRPAPCPATRAKR